MKNLIQFLFEKKWSKSKYNIGINNCEHLAKRIFVRFAKRKIHEIGRGSNTIGYDITMDMTNLVRELNLVSDKYKQYTSHSATHGGYLIFTELTLRLHHIAFVALLITESQMVLGLLGRVATRDSNNKGGKNTASFHFQGWTQQHKHKASSLIFKVIPKEKQHLVEEKDADNTGKVLCKSFIQWF